ncbi:MAG: serine protease [Xenococcaceae cyanobacterium]
MLVTCSSLLYQLSVQALPETVSIPVVAPSLIPEEQQVEELHQLAQAITVKVLSGKTWGSGIIIDRRGQIYTVLTNRHVLTPADSHRVQTSDGRIYPASISRDLEFKGNDLALLQFRSAEKTYTVASLGNSSTLAVGDEVFAAGFPFLTEAYQSPLSSIDRGGLGGFIFTRGQVSLVLEQALVEGYQIGYTNDIRKGMSGGPILNRRGEVIGINGMHAYPLWGDPYIYQDGSKPNQSLREYMRRYSWGIPVEKFMQLAGQFSSEDTLSPSSGQLPTRLPAERPVIPNQRRSSPLPELLW